MEKVTYSTKRKKRRTRRCLDEIKNRLRRKCGNSFEHSIINTKSCIIESKNLQNSLVTMDRLTLKSMFPNAITSETITRPVLEEIKQNQNVNFAYVKDSVKKPTFPSNQEFLRNNCNTYASFDNNLSFTDSGDNSMWKENNYKNHGEVKSSGSLVLFSPTGSANKAVTLSNKSVNKDAVTSSISLSQTSLDFRHRRYEELMNEIPSYIRHMDSFSHKSKEDTIKKTINNLQKLYMESCRKECKENTMKSNNGCVLTTSKKIKFKNQSIVEHSLDYMRLEQERQQRSGSRLQSLSDSPSPAGAGADNGSPASPCASPPDIRIGLVPYDTPDYNYYPHPLK